MDAESETFVASCIGVDGFDASEDGTGRGTPLVACGVQEDNQNGVIVRDIAGSLRSEAPGSQSCGTLAMVPVAIQAGALRDNSASGPDGVGVQEHIAYTLEARAEVQAVGFQSWQSGVRQVEAHATLTSNNGSRHHNGVVQAIAVRRLTPEECEALQGFRRGFTNIPGAADGPRYRSLGNSMAVPVMAWIGRRIKEAYAND